MHEKFEKDGRPRKSEGKVRGPCETERRRFAVGFVRLPQGQAVDPVVDPVAILNDLGVHVDYSKDALEA